MYTKTLLWKAAKATDEGYKTFKSRKAKTCTAIEKLPSECHETMYGLLDPDAKTRLSVIDAIKNSWMQNAEKCSFKSTASSNGSCFNHHHIGPG